MNLRFSIFCLLLFSLIACKSSFRRVTHAKDYEMYMKTRSQESLHSLQIINEDIKFWNQRLEKTKTDPVSRVKLAGLYSSRFKVTGNINDIHASDSLYLLANPLIKIGSSSVYKALAANCITEHKFQQAKLYIDTALMMGDGKYTSLLMQCDVSIELGDLGAAKKALSQIEYKTDFDYLIREAKLLDHKGNQDNGIRLMEGAAKQVLNSNNDKLFRWVKTNLGDMYGHANRFDEAYHCYLEVLKKYPEDFYALKGIAWLAFSHDKDVKEAKRILYHLSSLHPVPDYKLIIAKIAAFENNQPLYRKMISEYVSEVKDYRYGDMYNKYLFNIDISDQKINEALKIAKREVSNRPTPQSYDLLSWAYYKAGKKENALKLAKDFVENKCFEPEAFYHLGVIYRDGGENEKAKDYLHRAENSAFELGPGGFSEVQEALKKL
jgi:tetratricopeptide (TPR) repeat protein